MEGGYSSMNVSTKFVQLLLTFVLTNCGFPFWLTIGELVIDSWLQSLVDYGLIPSQSKTQSTYMY